MYRFNVSCLIYAVDPLLNENINRAFIKSKNNINRIVMYTLKTEENI